MGRRPTLAKQVSRRRRGAIVYADEHHPELESRNPPSNRRNHQPHQACLYQYSSGTYISQALNSFYTFTPNVSISQPLLRGFGFDVNAQSIRIAFYQYQQAQARTKLEVIRVLAETDRAYWHLYASRKQLGVRQQQLDLAVKQLDHAKAAARSRRHRRR